MKPSMMKTMMWMTMTAHEARLEERQPEIGREARQARADDAGDHAARRHIGDRLGAETRRAPARRRQSDRAACWRWRSPGRCRPGTSPESCRCRGRWRRSEAPTMPMTEPVRKPNLRPRRIISIEAGKHRQHDAEMLHGDRQVRPHAHVGRNDGQHRQRRGREHQRVAALGQRLARSPASAMLRSERRGMRAADTARRFLTFIDPSIGRAL